jgi:DNA topoisomerase-1
MINRAVEAVATRLGNTKAVCRKSYIHPAILDAYLAGKPLSGDEAAVIETIRGATIIARCRRAS